MKRSNEFRHWVQDIWRENCEERMVWQDEKLSLAHYFARYKWWLKREFRYQKSLDR